MTVSSQLQTFLLGLQGINEPDIGSSILKFLKIFGELVSQPLLYVFSFQWLNDLLYRVNTLPGTSVSASNPAYMSLNAANMFQEHLATPWASSPGLAGFWSGLFLCIPLSISHLYSCRESLTNNTRLGFIALYSTVIGSAAYHWYISSPLAGWFSQFKFGTFLYLLTLATLIVVVYQSIELKAARLSNLGTISFAETGNWRRHVALPFALSWMEQIICFPYISSIGDPMQNVWDLHNASIGTILVYGVSLLLGITLGVYIFSYGLQFVSQILWNILRVNPRLWRERINTSFSIGILILTFASVPYYTLDYLMTSSIGLHSSENIINENAQRFYQKIKSNPRELLNLEKMDYESYDTLPTRIIAAPEELDYRGEKDVENRFQRQAEMANEQAKNFIRTIFQKLNIDMVAKPSLSELGSTNASTTSSAVDVQTPKTFTSSRRWKQLNKFDLTSSGNPEESRLQTTVTQSGFMDNSMMLPIEGIQAKIKSRYYDNPLYRTLLKGDIALFLLNQPKDHFVNTTDLTTIIERQKSLKDYSNSMRKYRRLPAYKEFNKFFDGSKSFSNKLTSHQAKGSLRTVRRLFRLDLKPGTNQLRDKTLRYDQPLYTTKDPQAIQTKLIHEDLSIGSTLTNYNLSDYHPVPLYAGWDSDEHKFVLTNRYLSPYLSTSTWASSNTYEIKKTNDYNVVTYPLETKSELVREMQEPDAELRVKRARLRNVLAVPRITKKYDSTKRTMDAAEDTIPYYATLKEVVSKIYPPARGVFIYKP